MPWEPLARIAFAVAIYPFQPVAASDLPLEIGDELYIIEQGGKDKAWLRGYLIAPPSLLAGLTSVKGQTLEARVFSGIFPRSCVEIREVLGGDSGGALDGLADNEVEEEEEDVEEAAATAAAFVNGQAAVNGGGSSAHGGEGESSSLAASRKSSRKESAKARGKRPVGAPATTSEDGGRKRKPGRRPSQRSKTSGTALQQPVLVSGKPASRDPDAPKPPAPVPMLKVGDETPTSAAEPLVDEIASCLREWHSCHLHELLLARQYPRLEKFSHLIRELDFSRRQLLHNVLTSHELRALREKTVWNLVRGNKLLSGEVIVRDPQERGRMLTGDDSAVEMTRLQSMMSLLDSPPTQPHDTVSLHHILVSIKSAVGNLSEPTSLVWSICSKSPGSSFVPVTESYLVEFPTGPLSSFLDLDLMKTLFIDLGSTDIGEGNTGESELYFVVKVLVKQATMETGSSSPVNATLPRDFNAPERPDPGMSPRTMTGSVKGGRRSMMWGSQNATGASYWGKAGKTLGIDQPPNGISGGLGSPRPHILNGNSSAKSYVNRQIAVGVYRMTSLLRKNKEMTRSITLWTPVTMITGDKDREEGWEDIIPELLTSKSDQFVKYQKLEKLELHIKPFLSSDAESLIKKTPTLLQNITTTSKIGFSGAPTKSRDDIYLTLNEAFLPRHALLSHPRTGSLPIPQSLASSQLQMTVEIRRATGEAISDCIVPASNVPAVTVWRSICTERGQAFNETIKLALPATDVPGSHVFITLMDGPENPFALAWMPLWDQQAFMRDGHHSLLLYKYDELTSSPTSTSSVKGGYLSLPWNSRGKDDVSKDEAVTGPVATIRMHSFLCSTRFSQDKVLLGLLKWKDRANGELGELLQRVVFVPEIEIVKLLSDVFDALFGILVEHAGNDDYEDLVFNALVTVLGIVHDRRFNLGPLVDQYAENRFNYPFATSCLMRSFSRLLANPTDSNSSRKLRATFKVGRHILKFIINAREQQKVKEAGIGITSTQPTFTRDLQSIFKSLEALMTNTSPVLVGSQTLAVQHFHTWLPELSGLISTEEILHIAIDFVDSCSNVKNKLILYKLILIINYSRLELFSHAETRLALTVNTVRWLAPHWGKTDFVTEQWRDQVRLCCSVLSTQVNELGSEISEYLPKVVESYRAIQSTERKKKDTLSLLFPTTYPFPTKRASGQPVFDEALIELAAILAAMSALPTGMHFDLEEAELSEFLSETLAVHKSIISGEAFPSTWLSVHVYHHKSTMQTLEHLAGILVDSFLPHPDDAEKFNTELWRTFFSTLLKLVGSEALALEVYPEQKRRAVWKIAGDIREHGADLLRRTWEAIGWETSPEDRRRYGLEKMGGYQVQYVPGLVPQIVELCLSVHESLRSVAVQVLQTMIVSEWTLSQDLSVVQAEMIDCLDRLFKSKHLNESIQSKFFIHELTSLFEPLSESPNNAMWTAFKDLTATIDEFLDLLVAVHSTDMTGEAVHIMHTLRLMEFLRDMQKEDIFIRYVHQLAKVQAESRYLTEAGLALKLHADIYAWDLSKRAEELTDPRYPEQSTFERKELLYFEMIKHFEDGKAWDNALAAYRELAEQYETNNFDFAKLARTQRAMARIYELISKGERQTPRYFKVTYRGLGFPVNLRDKHFILEGAASERMSAFTDRMQQQHPSAQIVSSGDIEVLEGQFLQITTVTPHRDLSHPVYQRTKIPQAMREHLLSARPTQFAITTRRHASDPDVKEHFVEKTIFTTTESFPTILRRSEIVDTKEVRFTAIQSGIERTVRKTHELTAHEKKHKDNWDYDFAPFIDAINASVDPLSGVSVCRYRALLPVKPEVLDPENFEEEEEELELDSEQNALKIALLDHALVLRRCIALFSRNPNSNQRIVFAQQDFSEKFEITFAPEIQALTPLIDSSASSSPPFSPMFDVSIPAPALPTSQRAINTSAATAQTSFETASPVLPGSFHQHAPHSSTASTASARRQSRHEKNRLSLSFLKRGPSETTPVTTPLSASDDIRHLQPEMPAARSSTSRSRSKSANRRSWLGRSSSTDIAEESESAPPPPPPPPPINLPSISTSGTSVTTGSSGRMAASTTSATKLLATGNGVTRTESNKEQRPTTGGSLGDKSSSRTGSVKKRFSLLKLGSGSGRKARATGQGVDAVAEE